MWSPEADELFSLYMHCLMRPNDNVLIPITNHLKATLIGVVRHEVNMSAGSSEFIGNNSPTSQAASWMQSLDEVRLELIDESSRPPLHTRDPSFGCHTSHLQLSHITSPSHCTDFNSSDR